MPADLFFKQQHTARGGRFPVGCLYTRSDARFIPGDRRCARPAEISLMPPLEAPLAAIPLKVTGSVGAGLFLGPPRPEKWKAMPADVFHVN